MNSYAVLGLGKFGMSLAENLYLSGADVLAVDRRAELVNQFSGKVTSAMIADLVNEEEVRALGLESVDEVIVAMGGHLEASVMAVALAKELGVPRIVAKSSSETMDKILLRVGADRIVNPETLTGKRMAKVLTSTTLLEYFDVDDNLCLIEMTPRNSWTGRSLSMLNLRRKFGINVVSVKSGSGLWKTVDPAAPIKEDDMLLIAMEKSALTAEFTTAP